MIDDGLEAAGVHVITLPLRHPGTVNAWLLAGDPLTLIDTGPGNDDALVALEAGLERHGVALRDIDLVLATHHHLDHVGLTAAIQRRSGARVAVLDRLANYGARYHARAAADRVFSRALMAAHGVPRDVIDANEHFWDTIVDNTEDFVADDRLVDGDVIRAGGRDLRIVDRPGHSTTDTLLVDDAAKLAFVGDHLLAGVSSNTEMYPADGRAGERPHSRVQYLENLRRTGAMELETLLTGHGPVVTDHARLVQDRLDEHVHRADDIAGLLAEGPRSAFAIAQGLWRPETVREQPLLVVWEVLGHLDLLTDSGRVAERVGDDGGHLFTLVRRPGGGPPPRAVHQPQDRSNPRVPLSADSR